MSRARARRSHKSDIILLGTLGGAALVGIILLILWLTPSGRDSQPVKDFPFAWTVAPAAWKPPLADPGPLPDPSQGGRLEIYLDTSKPMGGFLPPPELAQESSGFRSLVDEVPNQMVSAAGGTSSAIQWFDVAKELSAPHGQPNPLIQKYFKGNQSKLDAALRPMMTGLDRGEVKMAALVTDLIATEDLIGALGAAQALSDWAQSGRVRTGELAIGLFGARVSYWGISNERCKPAADHLGCWFSEQAQQYRPLTRVAKKPFYILILGRGFDNVDQAGNSLLKAAQNLGLDAHWELLSKSSHSWKIAPPKCQARNAEDRKQEQFALLRNKEGVFQCQRAEAVELVCPLPNGALAGSLTAWVSWDKGASAKIQDNQVVFTIDCAHLRSSQPTTDLVATLEGPPEGGWAEEWKKWSAETDDREQDLGGTLHLEDFIRKVWLRPDRIRMTSETILKAPGR